MLKRSRIITKAIFCYDSRNGTEGTIQHDSVTFVERLIKNGRQLGLADKSRITHVAQQIERKGRTCSSDKKRCSSFAVSVSLNV